MVRKLSYLICFIFVAMLIMPANTLALLYEIDNFEGYASGLVNTVAKPPWNEQFNVGAQAANINQADVPPSGTKYLTVRPAPLFDQTSATWKPIQGSGASPIATTDLTTTLYLRFYAETYSVNSSFGLSSVAAPVGYLTGSFGEFANQMRVSTQAASGGFGFDFHNGVGWAAAGDRYTALQWHQWYNLWAVIHRPGDGIGPDTWDVYLTQGNNDATNPANVLFSRFGMGFRKKAPAASLVTMLTMSQGSALLQNNNPLSLDDIYLTPGLVLTIPEPATMILLGLGSLALLKRRKS